MIACVKVGGSGVSILSDWMNERMNESLFVLSLQLLWITNGYVYG